MLRQGDADDERSEMQLTEKHSSTSDNGPDDERDSGHSIAHDSDASRLLELTATDLQMMKIRKQLEELPRREELLQLRTKLAQALTKSKQVQQMRKECDMSLAELADEDVMLRAKQADVSVQIDKARDHKEVAALAKELEGLAKRVEKVEFDSLKLMERSDKIAVVEAQVSTVVAGLQQQDEKLMSELQATTAKLKKAEQDANELRERLLAAMPVEMSRRYEKAREAKGVFGGARIEGTHCSGCHVEYTEGQMANLLNGPRLFEGVSECPYCHRLLVVQV